MDDNPVLGDLADAVLDGGSVDWHAAEASAGAAVRPLVRDFELVAAVGRLHRQVLPVTSDAVTTWGHLRLVEHVGRGATGDVFRAWDTRLDREVALKLIVGDAAAIIREGRLLAKVHHPNVVTIHGAEHIDQYVGLWMEFVRGQTLERLQQEGRTFTSDEVTQMGVELCRAVSAVHAFPCEADGTFACRMI